MNINLEEVMANTKLPIPVLDAYGEKMSEITSLKIEDGHIYVKTVTMPIVQLDEITIAVGGNFENLAEEN